MPRDGSGNYTRPVNSVDPAVSNTNISSTDFNSLTLDVATEVTDSLSRSGKGAMLAALGMGGNKISNLGTPAIASDAARLDNITSQSSPTITTPTIITPTITTGGTWSSPVFANASLTGTLSIQGMVTGSFAGAGLIGEVITANNVLALTALTNTNITSVNLSAGNWMLFGQFNTAPNGNQANVKVAISTVNTSVVSLVGNACFSLNFKDGLELQTATEMRGAVGPAVVSIGSATTYYLNCNCNFVPPCNMGGVLTALRIG